MEKYRGCLICSMMTKYIEYMSKGIVSFCLFFVVIIVMVDVVLRTFFQSGFPGTVEISEYLLIIIAFMGLVQTNSAKGHLSVDLIYNTCSPTIKKVLTSINRLLLIILFVIFFWAGLNRALSAQSLVETSWFGSHVLPVWMIRWIVPISCGLFFLQIISELFNSETASISSE